MREQQNAELTR
jgi:hypothetical protein